jgi:hypothetical protein
VERLPEQLPQLPCAQRGLPQVRDRFLLAHALTQLVALLPEGVLDLLAFADVREQADDLTRLLVGAEELVGRHVIQVPTDDAAIDDGWMRADDVQDQLRGKELAVVLAQRVTIVLGQHVGQPTFVLDPPLEPRCAADDPFGLARRTQRPEPLTHRLRRRLRPEREHPFRIEGSALQIGVLLRLQDQAVRRDGPFDVDAPGMHRIPHDRLRPIVRDVDALLAALEADPDEGNGHREVLLRALVDRAQVVVRRQLCEGRQQGRFEDGVHLHGCSLFG